MQQDSTHPTGVAPSDGEKPDADQLLAARTRKAIAAAELVVHHNYSWGKVARALGFPTARAAIVAVETTLAKNFTITDRAAIRAMLQMRYDALLKPVWGKATDGDDPLFLAANKRAQEILDRYAKLTGADAPVELVIYSPSEAEIEAWIGEVTGQQHKELPEADIFAGDVVEAEWSEADAVEA